MPSGKAKTRPRTGFSNKNLAKVSGADGSDSLGKAGHFAGGCVLVHDALGRRTHQLGLCRQECCQGDCLVAGQYGFFDLADECADTRAARLVHFGTGRDLAGRLLGRGGVGHGCLSC